MTLPRAPSVESYSKCFHLMKKYYLKLGVDAEVDADMPRF